MTGSLDGFLLMFMNSYHSLKNKKEFLDVYRHGKHKRNDYFVFFRKENGLDYDRYGVSVTYDPALKSGDVLNMIIKLNEKSRY